MFQLIISDIRQLTAELRVCQLRTSNADPLPLISAGAYLQISLTAGNVTVTSQQYPICSDPAWRDSYEIMIDDSMQLHADIFIAGALIECELPGNHFHLHADPSPSVLIAEGIGIAAIKPLVHTLVRRGRRLQLHYVGASVPAMAFNAELDVGMGNRYCIYPADQGKALDIAGLLAESAHNAMFYVSGSSGFIDSFCRAAEMLGIARDQIQTDCVDRNPSVRDKPVIIELLRSSKLIQVGAEQPLLAALHAAGVAVDFDCCVGECGTCACKVVEGEVDHRDSVLSDAARANGMMCVCVSRAHTDRLVLDL